jgi:hypothetical protein
MGVSMSTMPIKADQSLIHQHLKQVQSPLSRGQHHSHSVDWEFGE